MGDGESVIAHWRKILASLPALSQEWLEAKHAIISIHTETDPARAAAVLTQFDALHPSFDDPTWSSRFDELRIRLGEAKGGVAP